MKKYLTRLVIATLLGIVAFIIIIWTAGTNPHLTDMELLLRHPIPYIISVVCSITSLAILVKK